MEKGTLKNDWDDYLPIGLAVAIYISYMDISRDHLFLLVPVIVFFAITGFKDNVKELIVFIKKYWLFATIIVVYLVYYIFTRNMVSIRFTAATFGVVFAGYMASVRSGNDSERLYKKIWIFLMAVIVLGTIRSMVEKKSGLFVSNQVELEAVLLFAGISILFFKDIRYRIVGGTVSAIVATSLLLQNTLNLSNAFAIGKIIPVYLQGSFMEKVFGRGMLSTGFFAPECNENTFTTYLFDYGIMALALYIAAFFYAVFVIVRSKDIVAKKHAIMVCVIIVSGSFYHMEYWTNIIFLIYTIVGVLLGYTKDKRSE